MSSPARRKELAEQRRIEELAREAERWRKEALSMYDRIEESDASDSVKDIPHRLAGSYD